MFVGRKEILQDLETLWRKRTSSIVACRGRRRIGKSTLIREFARRTADAYIEIEGLPPSAEKPMSNQDEIDHFEAVADNSPVPVVLYNVPGRVGVNLQSSTCVELAKHPNIIAVKEASGNLQQIMEILRDKPSDFDVLSGDDGITQPMMALGAKGVISVAANGYPSVFAKMVSLMMNGDTKTALDLHYKMLRINNLIFADGNPSGIKCLLAKQNICKNILRLPLVPVNDNVKIMLENELDVVYKNC